jgi:hypothetical protein
MKILEVLDPLRGVNLILFHIHELSMYNSSDRTYRSSVCVCLDQAVFQHPKVSTA